MSERDWRATQVKTYKLIASGATATDKAKLLVYPYDAALNLSGGIDQTKFVTSSIGADTWMFVSGGVKTKGDTTIKGVVTFGGDTFVSGVLYASSGFSGSLQRLLDGTPYLVGGPGVTITTQSNGAVAISASAASGSVIAFGICDYGTTALTTHTTVGQLIFNPAIYSGSVKLRAALSATGPVSASIRLYNVGGNSYVEIGGPSITTLTTTATSPTVKESVDLTGALNFGTGSQIYELQLATENATYPAYVGGGEFRVTGSLAVGDVSYQSCSLYRTTTTTPSAQNAIIYTFPMPVSSCIDFEAGVVAMMTGSAFNRARYRRNFLAYRSGSADATIEGATVYATAPDLESSSSWTYNIQAIGTNIQFEVTGSASEHITWKLKLDRNELP